MKGIRLFVICCIVFLLTGCIDNELGDENEDRANVNQNYLNYKQDIYCEWGRESAFYKDRIYYFQSGDEPGIYSMDTRGKDKRSEVYVENIRKLQVRDDGIYYAAPMEGGYPRRYTIYKKDWKSAKAQEYPIMKPQLEYGEENVWDFYIQEDNTIIIIDIYAQIPLMNLIFQVFIVGKDNTLISMSEYEDYLVDYIPKEIEDKRTNIFGYEDLLVMTETGLESRKRDEFSEKYVINMGEANLTIYDGIKNETAFFRNYTVYNKNQMNSMLQTIYGETFVISNRNYLLWVPKNGQTAVQKLELPEITDVRYSVLDGEDLLVIADQDKKQEYIYRVSLETAEIKEAAAIEEGQKVLAVYKDMLYTVSEDALYVYQYGEKGYEEKEHVEWKEKLENTCKLEMSGNVVFVYDVDEKSAEFVLKEYQVLDIFYMQQMVLRSCQN